MTALEDFPRELTLTERPGRLARWVLSIHAPDLSGEISSSSKATVEAMAEAYGAMRRDQESADR